MPIVLAKSGLDAALKENHQIGLVGIDPQGERITRRQSLKEKPLAPSFQ